MKRIAVLPLVLLCLAAGPTSRQAAEPWLDRAAASFAQAVDLTKQYDYELINLGGALVRLRGTDADKALLRKAMAKPLVRGEKEIDEAWAINQIYYDVYPLIDLGETDAARAKIAKAEALYAELDRAGKKVGLYSGLFMLTYEYMGDAEAAARWRAVWHKPVATTREAWQIELDAEPDSIAEKAAKERVGEGDAAGALTELKKIKSSYSYPVVLRNLAELLQKRGQEDDARRLVLDAVKTVPNLSYIKPQDYQTAAEACLDVGEKKAAAALLRRIDKRHRMPWAYSWASVALTAARAGDTELAREFLAHGESLPKEVENIYGDRRPYDIGEIFKSDLTAAAVHVHLGDLPAAGACYQRLKPQMKDSKAWSQHDHYLEVYANALIETGKLDEAVALLNEALPDPKNHTWYLIKIAKAHCTAGRHEKAWDIAMSMKTEWLYAREGLLRHIAKSMCQADKAHVLVPRMVSLPAKTRTIINLGIAEMYLGRTDLPYANAYDR